MKIQKNKTKSAVAILTALVIGVALLSPTTILPSVNAAPQSNVDYLPNPVLTDTEKQQLISIATSQPGIQAWSNQWNFSTINFKGEKTSTGVNWQEAIVFLRLSPSAPASIKCVDGWVAEVRIDMTTHKVIDSLYPTMQSHECYGITLSPLQRSAHDPHTKAIASDNDVQTTNYFGNFVVMTTPSYSSTIFSKMNYWISYLLNAEFRQSCSGPDPNCFLQGGWLITTPSSSVGGIPANSADIIFVDESVTGTLNAYNTYLGYSGGSTENVGINCLSSTSKYQIQIQYGTSTYVDNSNVACTAAQTSSQYNNSVFFENANTSPYTATGWAPYVTGSVQATSATEYSASNTALNWSSSTNWQKDCTTTNPPVASNAVINSGNLQNGGTAVWGGLTNVLTAC